jgi:NTE family protein
MQKKKVSLALQGGGAHGAFAWGVADRLLEDGRFDIEGVSGTSAGGMNAASIVQGLIKGGPEAARATLKDYWRSMSELSKKISPYSLNPLDKANNVNSGLKMRIYKG